MRVAITDKLVRKTAPEGTAVPFTVTFWDDSTTPWVAATPTSAPIPPHKLREAFAKAMFHVEPS